MVVAVDPGYERGVEKVVYRESLDAGWTRLPRPPRFGSEYATWGIHVTDAGHVLLHDVYGRQYVVFRPSTGAWSRVHKAPITSWNGELWGWTVTDTGFMMATGTGWQNVRVAVGEIGSGWRTAAPLPGPSRCRSFHLADDGVVTVLETAAACGKRNSLQSRDLAPAATSWSRPEVLGRGIGFQRVYLLGNGNGDLLVALTHRNQFGFDRPDTLWRRSSGSAWSRAEYVPGGYGLRAKVFGDGTSAVTTRRRGLDPGIWLSLHD